MIAAKAANFLGPEEIGEGPGPGAGGWHISRGHEVTGPPAPHPGRWPMTGAKITDAFNDDPVLLPGPGARCPAALRRGNRVVLQARDGRDHPRPRSGADHRRARATRGCRPARHGPALGRHRGRLRGRGLSSPVPAIDQRSAEEVETSRANSRARQERHRHQNRDHSLCDARYCQASNGVRNAVTDGVSNGSPIRPDRSRAKAREGRRGGTADSAGALPPAPTPSRWTGQRASRSRCPRTASHSRCRRCQWSAHPTGGECMTRSLTEITVAHLPIDDVDDDHVEITRYGPPAWPLWVLSSTPRAELMAGMETIPSISSDTISRRCSSTVTSSPCPSDPVEPSPRSSPL